MMSLLSPSTIGAITRRPCLIAVFALGACLATAQWAPSGSIEARNNSNIAMQAGFPDWDSAMYASGTNNRAMARVSWGSIPGQPNYWTFARITGVVLKLDGTTVRSWTPGYVAPPSIDVGVMVDSTHFESESSITWRMEASIYLSNDQTSTTESFVREVEVPVRNWARLFGRYDLEVDFLTWVDDDWVSGVEGAQGCLRPSPRSMPWTTTSPRSPRPSAGIWTIWPPPWKTIACST